MTEAEELLIRFGTTEPPPPSREVSLGPLAFRVEGGAIRWLRWRGAEAVRGLAAPIRDEGWGTWPEEDAAEEAEESPGRFRLVRRFRAAGGALAGTLAVDAAAGPAGGAVEVTWSLRALRDVRVARAGFCLLHPLDGVAGEALTGIHPDGRREETAFPAAIAPSQPVFAIRSLVHRVAGAEVGIAFLGDVWEMEDQRNWADASFKTYCRPLALPTPYLLAAGETVEQSVTISLRDAPDADPDPAAACAPARAAARPAGAAPEPSTARAPAILLAHEPGWPLPEGARTLGGLLLRLRAGEAGGAALDAVARVGAGAALDLEAVVPAGADLEAALDALARDLALRGLRPGHVVALPEAYLRSYQPDAAWPGPPSPEDATAAARRAFPEAQVGTGMLTYFTELNRRPPQGGAGAFLTHSTAAIVHAADDASVLETLEALPQVFADARRLAGGAPLRLGLVAIAMRTNPYGPGLAPNAGRVRRTMTDDDPRQAGLLAAAYAVAAAAAAARAGVAALALGAPAGPFGALGLDGAARPVLHAALALHAASGREVWPDPVPGLRGLAWAGGAVLANASLAPVAVPAPHATGAVLSPATAAAARDPAWLGGAAGLLPPTVTLGPCDVLFAGDAAARPDA